MSSKCSISGYTIEKNPDWIFSSKDKSYTIEVSFINQNIVHLDFSGNGTLENRQSIWYKIENLISEKLTNQKYYLLQNFSKVKGSSSLARYKYINWLFSEKNKIAGIYFYQVPPNILVSMKAAMIFVNKKDWLFIMDSYKEAIIDIKSKIKYQSFNIANSIDLRKRKDIGINEWEDGIFIIGATGAKYFIKRKWIHEIQKAKTITYLINQDILVRFYIGEFGDQTLEHTAKSLDDILESVGLKDKPYHFYIDFTQTTNVSLKYRKDSVRWYKENNQYILTSGFFHMTPILRMGVNFARSFAKNEHLISKVHLLSNVSEMFDKIEGFNYSGFESTQRKKEYRKLSKKQLIAKLERIEEEQKSQIESIKVKLGRLSWDQDLSKDKFEIDNTDNPFADVHNSLRLIQDDLSDILCKRDELIHKAEESDQLKSAFLANTSHEIRTPMNSIIGFSSLMEEMENMPAEALEYIQIIKRNSHFLLALINDIIDISKIEAGQLNIAKRRVPLNSFFNEFKDVFNNQSKEVELKFINHLEKVELNFNTDQIRLKQIIFNLMSNAIKFTKEGFVQLEVDRIENNLIFTITDTGIGIPQEDLTLLFQRFGRSSDSQKNIKYKGSGLGLPISKACVELLGGSIQVDSELGKGSKFSIQFPIE